MRCLERNKTAFSYCQYTGNTPIMDGSYETGEYKRTYGSATVAYGNVSSAKGAVQVEQFGSSIDYDKVIVMDDPNCEINENTVLFVDKSPEFDAGGNPLFDYIVSRVARSLNSVSYAIQRVKVS